MKDCIEDLSHMKTKKQQEDFLKAEVSKFLSMCPNHEKIKFHMDVKIEKTQKLEIKKTRDSIKRDQELKKKQF